MVHSGIDTYIHVHGVCVRRCAFPEGCSAKGVYLFYVANGRSGGEVVKYCTLHRETASHAAASAPPSSTGAVACQHPQVSLSLCLSVSPSLSVRLCTPLRHCHFSRNANKQGASRGARGRDGTGTTGRERATAATTATCTTAISRQQSAICPCLASRLLSPICPCRRRRLPESTHVRGQARAFCRRHRHRPPQHHFQPRAAALASSWPTRRRKRARLQMIRSKCARLKLMAGRQRQTTAAKPCARNCCKGFRSWRTAAERRR